MNYTIKVGQWGAECMVGVIPDEIWKYIEDECDGEASTYAMRLDEGEVPEKFKMADDSGSFYEPAGCVDILYNNSGAYASTELSVTNEKGKEVLSTCPDDLAFCKESIISVPEGKHIFVWQSVEKACWISGEFEAKRFSKKKLKASVDSVMKDGKCLLSIVNYIEYDDGEETFETDCSESRGVSYELDFY